MAYPDAARRQAMTAFSEVVFLLDVDNTLLDNDRIQEDLRSHLECEFGLENRDLYWAIFEELRAELGYADCLGALQRCRLTHLHEPRLLLLSSFLVDYPFADRLYPHALDVIERLRSSGPTVILSDGDVVFQPRKIERSGLCEAVDGHVLISIHKEQQLAAVEQRYPAQHYVMVDDKPRILAAVKETWGTRLTTVCPRQGALRTMGKPSPPTRPAISRLSASGICSGMTCPTCLQPGGSAVDQIATEVNR